MPQITIHVGGREQLEPAISKATPMGLLGTEAIVRLGATSITGRSTALRALVSWNPQVGQEATHTPCSRCRAGGGLVVGWLVVVG